MRRQACAWFFILAAELARAQDSAGDIEAHARFEAGRVAFQMGHFDDALADFRRAYELSPRPELLYNIGETCARMQRLDEALTAFEAYLSETPSDGPHHAQVVARVAILRDASRPVVESAPQPSLASDPAPWILFGVASAIVAGGAITLAVAEVDRGAVESATAATTFYSDAANIAALVPVLEGIGLAALSVGVTGIVSSLIWALSGASSRPANARLEPSLRWSL